MVHLKAVQNEGVVRNKKVLRAKVNEEVIVAMERPGCTRPMTSVTLWMKKNDGKPFSLEYQSRKHSFQESIVIQHKHFRKKRGGYGSNMCSSALVSHT